MVEGSPPNGHDGNECDLAERERETPANGECRPCLPFLRANSPSFSQAILKRCRQRVAPMQNASETPDFRGPKNGTNMAADCVARKIVDIIRNLCSFFGFRGWNSFGTVSSLPQAPPAEVPSRLSRRYCSRIYCPAYRHACRQRRAEDRTWTLRDRGVQKQPR